MDPSDGYRIVGVYTGRILKGEKAREDIESLSAVNGSERPANTSRIIGLVASFFGGAFLLLAYLMAFEDYVAWMVGITGGIGMLGCYVAFCCGRMGTSNFKNLD